MARSKQTIEVQNVPYFDKNKTSMRKSQELKVGAISSLHQNLKLKLPITSQVSIAGKMSSSSNKVLTISNGPSDVKPFSPHINLSK